MNKIVLALLFLSVGGSVRADNAQNTAAVASSRMNEETLKHWLSKVLPQNLLSVVKKPEWLCDIDSKDQEIILSIILNMSPEEISKKLDTQNCVKYYFCEELARRFNMDMVDYCCKIDRQQYLDFKIKPLSKWCSSICMYLEGNPMYPDFLDDKERKEWNRMAEKKPLFSDGAKKSFK